MQALISMTNSEIVEKLDEVISWMELLELNSFKINTFRNLSAQVEKTSRPLRLHTEVEITGTFSKTMAQVILSLLQTETYPEFDELEKQIPAGVRSMLQINGIGPKKVNTLWKDAGIATLEELKQACLRSQVSQLKGFGVKIQDTILGGIAFLESVQGKLLMHHG
ncbi:MAG TPA: helix-hairpin-helix domain-containing protein, partial [Catalimonadaceae bacterium]|nr:helix-hairpin-helix domain-containing protein [Catalimonadaceae bacterium]